MAERRPEASQHAPGLATVDRAVLAHPYLVNRGVLLTRFRNVALMCPDTTAADVGAHAAIFAAADELLRH
jgi:glutamate-1-semialdehyde 2,1-aminomutase